MVMIATGTAPPVSASSVEQPAKILLIDDEAILLRAFSRVLTAVGHTVVSTETAEAALAVIAEERFDAIFLDLCLPGAGGLQALAAIRALDPRVPVVLMTGTPTMETAIEAIGAGAKRYLIKPVTTPQLLTAVQEVVDAHRRQQRDYPVVPRPDHALLERGLQGLFMVYQPIVSWRRQQGFAHEALVRTSERAIPHPGALIDLAQRCGRLDELGRRIRAAAALVARDTPRLFVNLNPTDFLDEDLYDGTAPLSLMATSVVLEVTERAGLESIADLAQRLTHLRALGFRIAIDDLGEGYAGLTSLARVQPEFVKLDLSLVRNVDALQANRRIVRSTLRLCRELHCQVIAEGVETVAERDALVGVGCDLLQGYLFARPTPELIAPVLR
jgi:EAL domain-containing protein (putative c-di-GMP-specific phosphodiesterase class I)